MKESENLDIYKALVDDAFVNAPLHIRQNKAATILSKAQKLFPENDFKELREYAFEKLDK